MQTNWQLLLCDGAWETVRALLGVAETGRVELGQSEDPGRCSDLVV
jgi:hypothetical protein